MIICNTALKYLYVTTALLFVATTSYAQDYSHGGFGSLLFIAFSILVNIVLLSINLLSKAGFGNSLMYGRLPFNLLGVFVYYGAYLDRSNTFRDTIGGYLLWAFYIGIIAFDLFMIRKQRKGKKSL